jgi:hypothetical protein
MTSYYIFDNPDGGGRIMLILYQQKLVMLFVSRQYSALSVLKPTHLLRGWGVVHIKRLSPKLEKELEDFYYGVLRKAD